MADLDHARAAKARLREALADHDGIEGVGLAPDGDGYCVQVNVTRTVIATDIPADVDGVSVHVHVVGPVRALGGDG
ncbi:hypothetical protein J4G33_04305 [Actinotalea sp. BY-33]|uniref:Uncharacterized protein n=1 Tax=Actinotalea soli TaxID=2819234 RepID=A0A939LNU6_9CELL|nr:hypothetical protein [Actinotalea soli]MBO1751019.1 hypothetical protein [Actinotalea soli]